MRKFQLKTQTYPLTNNNDTIIYKNGGQWDQKVYEWNKTKWFQTSQSLSIV